MGVERRFEVPSEVLKIADDIRSMRVRGAGRIARAAARALMIAAEKCSISDRNELMKYMEYCSNILLSTRPTAVSLPNAIAYVMYRLKTAYEQGKSTSELIDVVIKAATEFIKYSEEATKKIGEIGAKLIEDGDVVLTHCNSAAAVAVIVQAHREGKRIGVYATETRPKFQGYITTQWLIEAGLRVHLIPDSAVRYFMKKITKVVVGADTVAANGAVINKVGTSLIALAAKEAGVPFYVAAETYKFSPATVTGELVIIEERDPTEVVPEDYLKRNPRITVRNPSFDVTPPEYITAIITEYGVIPPQAAILILREHYGWAIQEKVMKLSKELEDDRE
ncbi:MAG: ribose 1,5-bisphosphate isomerase [Thermoprotei archaeon]|nr:MAG: ribose 1,5-bisphosphate isomerase [Thermoprotei archaeon]